MRPSATRPILRALALPPIASPVAIRIAPAPLRPFSSSPLRRASEVPRDPLADPEIQSFYEKLRNHQGAVDAMMALAKVMQDKGVDTTKPPSMMQMMKLSMDKDMREAGQKLVAEMKAAGVEMNPEMMRALFEKMKQQ